MNEKGITTTSLVITIIILLIIAGITLNMAYRKRWNNNKSRANEGNTTNGETNS